MILVIHDVYYHPNISGWCKLSSKKWMILVTHDFGEEWIIQLNDIYQLDHNAGNKFTRLKKH